MPEKPKKKWKLAVAAAATAAVIALTASSELGQMVGALILGLI